jgi:predicted esterase
MRKLLYFHGFGTCAEKSLSNKRDIIDAIAGDVVAFDAPFDAEGGMRKWFTLPEGENKNHDAMPELEQSCEFIKQKIRELEIDESDMILFGASQGGFMALYLTLNNMVIPNRAIAAVPFYPLELVNENINKTTPILWANAGRDERITGPVRDTWRDLQNAGAKVDYVLDPESEHDEWSPAMKEKIIEWGMK